MNRAHSRYRPKNPNVFSPASLFIGGIQGVWFDPSDMSTMFQDSSGTTPVTAAGQPVGLIRDKSGNGNHAAQPTASSRPILRNSVGLWWLEFDGVDDWLETASIPFGSTAMYTSCGIRKTSDTAIGMVAELSVSSTANTGTFFIDAPASPGLGNLGVRFNGTVLRDRMSPNTFPSPVAAVMSGIGDIIAGTTQLRVNGVIASTDASGLGTGTFKPYALYIGRRGGATLPFVGNLYSLIVRGSTSSVNTIISTERYIGQKTGIIL